MPAAFDVQKLGQMHSALEDYSGATGSSARTYDGHSGLDLSLSGVRAMDAGVDVAAAPPGRVIRVVDGMFDRNTVRNTIGCSDSANLVVIEHQTEGRNRGGKLTGTGL